MTDVWETDGEIVYAFDLPGIPEEKLSVEFEDGSLTVSAERERSEEISKESHYRVERRCGKAPEPRRIQIGAKGTIEGKAKTA